MIATQLSKLVDNVPLTIRSLRGNSNTNGLPVGMNGNSSSAAAVAAANSSWLSKLSPSKPPSYTKNQIIDFYCQAGDVQL